MIKIFKQRFRSIRLNTRSAFLCAPALVLTLGYGLISGDIADATVAATGSLIVGFGSVQAFTRHRWAAMVLAAVGMSVSAFSGSLAGNSEITAIAISALWAAACAMFASIELGAWWIILQWSIALFVAAFYPADLPGAALRAALILAGGTLQIACVVVGWQLAGGPPFKAAHHSLRRVRKSLHLARIGKLPTLRHALRAAISVALATALIRWTGLPNGYWAPMTALIVLKPQLRATHTRGLERLIGTVVGAGIASLISLAAPSGVVLLGLAVVSAWLAYGLQRSDYVFFTMAITATIVFVLALDHEPELSTALHRLLATLLGGGLALSIAFLTNGAAWKRHRDTPATPQAP